MQGLALGGAVGVPGRASSVPWAPAPGTGTVPFLVLAALGRASESPGAWLTLRDWAPLPERQSLQVWGRLRVGFSDMSPGDPGATSLRAHVKNPCDTRRSSIPGGCVGTGSMLLAGRLPGRSHLMLEAAVTRKQWLPSPVRLPCGLLSWSAPQQTRDVAFLASFQLLLSDVAEGFLDHATLL